MNILKKALKQVQQPKCKTAKELLTFADIQTLSPTLEDKPIKPVNAKYQINQAIRDKQILG